MLRFIQHQWNRVMAALTLCALFIFVLRPDWGMNGIVLGVVAIITSVPTLKEGYEGILKRKITLDLFNSVALLASVALSEFPSAAFIALMLASARELEAVTRKKARGAVEELVRLRPKHVWVERLGKLQEVDPATVSHTDIVVVREGEQIPVDGEVIEGEAIVNEAPVTGESIPILKKLGDTVLSSSVSESGTLKLRPVRVGADTTFERIIHLIEEAEHTKAPAQRLADRFATWFFPAVLVLVAVAFLITKDVRVAIALLVVVCADDIAVSIPLAFFAAIGQAARQGVIVNGGEPLGRLGKATVVLFDKTGTLTYGHPRVETIVLAKGVVEYDFWHLVGSGEKYSKHPLAKAMLDAVAARHIVPKDPEHFEAVRGKGVRARVGGRAFLSGSHAFLEEEGVSGLPEATDGGEMITFVACDGKFLGALTVSDLPREEAAEAILELRNLGMRMAMVTGDNAAVAGRIADALGIDDVRAGLLPEDKVRIVREFREAGQIVAMIGDGINDAPALAAADIGIAMGGAGTAVAIETAQIVVMHDDLRRLAHVIRLSRRTRRVVIGNFGIWGITNAVGILGVFLRVLSPALAALYNFLTDFLPLANSLQLFRGVRIRSH